MRRAQKLSSIESQWELNVSGFINIVPRLHQRQPSAKTAHLSTCETQATYHPGLKLVGHLQWIQRREHRGYMGIKVGIKGIWKTPPNKGGSSVSGHKCYDDTTKQSWFLFPFLVAKNTLISRILTWLFPFILLCIDTAVSDLIFSKETRTFWLRI